MNTNTLSFIRYVSLGAVGCLMLLAPFFVHADTEEKPDRSSGVRSEVYAERHEFIVERQKERLCRVFAEHTPLSLPAFCDDDTEPDPDPEPEPETPTVSITADPLELAPNSPATLSWSSEHATACEASGAWSGLKAISGSEEVIVGDSTSEYSLECSGPGGSTSDSVVIVVEPLEPDPDPDPDPTVGYPLIFEVMYDLANDGSEGSEVGGANEWVELYNPTDATFDLANWKIGDGTSNDVISTTELLFGPSEYLMITNATSTADFWDLTNVTVVYLGSSISGGLANGGDSVKLFDSNDTLVDAMSYGTNVSAFDPSVPVVAPGSSSARAYLSVDTDTAADWFEDASPTPGF